MQRVWVLGPSMNWLRVMRKSMSSSLPLRRPGTGCCVAVSKLSSSAKVSTILRVDTTGPIGVSPWARRFLKHLVASSSRIESE